MIMDYCPGGDLDQLLYHKKKLEESVAKIYISEILLAIEFLHLNNIIYRDLKPSNIVLDINGHACLTDFGLSKANVQKNQKLASFCGSIAYLAPEMLSKQGHNLQLDWYLFGVLIYELLSGYPPFYSEDKVKLIAGIRRGKLSFPRYFSNEAKDIIDNLMIRNPHERLGANGAKEIKQHNFFKDINWTKVINRQLVPPKIKEPEILKSINLEGRKLYNVTLAREQDLFDKDQDQFYVENWSFAEDSE